MANEVHLDIDEGRLNEVVMGQTTRFVNGFVRRVVTEAVALAPKRTGALARSTHSDPVVHTGPWTIETGVSADVRYAGPVHEGARPHVIRPRRVGGVLAFQIGGRQIFAARVNHPGQRSQPFIRNAVHRVTSADPRITMQ